MKIEKCPTEPELRAFDSGILPASRYGELAKHLDSCAECAARYERLDVQPDRMLDHLRLKLPREILTDDSELHRLVDTAKNLGDTSISRPQTQDGDPSRRKPSLEQLLAHCLAPAEATDELGRLGGYRVLRVLGRGGMGIVCLAEDVALKRLVALKVMNPASSSDTSRGRFLREAQAMAAVHHDNVVTIFQVGEDRGAPFLAMQLLEGQSLADRLRAATKLSVSESLRIARETAQGLAAAHAKGLTHRDIKPDNIWLEAREEGRESRAKGREQSGERNDLQLADSALDARPSTLDRSRVKILDFGLARAADEQGNLTQSGAIVGTPNYLSPEQVLGGEVDARTDLFSLGVVLYEMLSGDKPFARTTLMATLRSIGSDSPRELDASIPADVTALVRRLLEKRPEDRFSTTAETIAAIERCEHRLQEASVPGGDSRSCSAGVPPANSSTTSAGGTPAPQLTKSRRVWIATAAAAAALVLFVLADVIVKIKDKDGKVIATIQVPDGTTVDTISGELRKPSNAKPAASSQQDHLAPMSPLALVERPAKLVAKDGDAVESWTVLPVGVPQNSAIALSADGLMLATFSHDGVVRVWDVEKKSLRKALLGHVAGPCSPAGKPADRSNWGYLQTNSRRFGPVAWRPQANENAPWLATASRDGSVRVWDVLKGTTVWMDQRDVDVINMLAWSPDGTKLAVGYDDGQVRSWEAADGKELKSLSLAEGPPFSLGWSPDSKLLAVHSAPSETANIAAVHVWDAVSGKQQRFESTRISGGGGPGVVGGQGHVNGISAMKWSPDGQRFAYKGVDCLLIHETTDWQQTERLTSGLKDRLYVQDFDWSPDGTSVLVSWNGQLVLHGLKSGEATAVPLEKGHSAEKVIWAPGSTQVALWIIDGAFTRSAILDAQSLEVRLSGGIGLNEFASDDRRLLVGGAHYPAVLKLDGDKVTSWGPQLQPQLNPGVLPIVWSPDGQWMTRGGSFWNLSANDGPKPTWSVQGSNFVSWSPDSKRFLVSTGGHGINYEFWSADDRTRLAAFEITSGFLSSAWSPDGSQLAVGGGDIFVRNGMTGQVERHLDAAIGAGSASSIAWSRRGDRMAFYGASGVQVIDANDGTTKFTLEGIPQTSGYHQNHWSPEDRHLIVVGVEELSVFAGDTGKYQTSFALRANTRAIHFLDADTALCGTQDGTVHRLELATGKQELVTRVAGSVIEISPDGQHLAIDRGGLSIYNLDGQLLTSFLAIGDLNQPLLIGANGHFWSNDQSHGPFWATKGSVPHTLVYVVQTASGQQTLTPLEFANRYGWQNDPSQVRLK